MEKSCPIACSLNMVVNFCYQRLLLSFTQPWTTLYPAFEIFVNFYLTFIHLYLQISAQPRNQLLRLVSIFPFCLVLHIFEIEQILVFEGAKQEMKLDQNMPTKHSLQIDVSTSSKSKSQSKTKYSTLKGSDPHHLTRSCRHSKDHSREVVQR